MLGEQAAALLIVHVAVQVLGLVAEAPGGDALPGVFHRVAVAVLGLQGHLHGALDNAVHAGEAQAALKALLLPFLADDLGVHQLQVLLVVVHDHHHTAENADLRGSQAQAAGVL